MRALSSTRLSASATAGKRSRGRALLLTAALLGAPAAYSAVSVLTAAPVAAQEISVEVGKPLKEAQDLAKAGKFSSALSKVNEAEKVKGATPYEKLVMADFKAYLLSQLGRTEASIDASKQAIATGLLPKDELPSRYTSVAQRSYQTKQYAQAIEWANKAKAAGSKDSTLDLLILQSYYLSGNYEESLKKAKSMASGSNPPKNVLELQLASAAKLENQVEMREALFAMAANHPSPETWKSLLVSVRSAMPRSNEGQLEFDRLRLAMGQMSKPSDYMEMAQLAIQAGLPGEAVSIMDAGYEAKVLGGEGAERQKRLLNLAKSEAKEDEPALANEPTASAKDKVAVADAYWSYGETEKALALYEAAFKQGGVSDPAIVRLHQGQALLDAGRRSAAIEAFEAASGDSDYGPLAETWKIYVASGK